MPPIAVVGGTVGARRIEAVPSSRQQRSNDATLDVIGLLESD
jgi:hypothetical protein